MIYVVQIDNWDAAKMRAAIEISSAVIKKISGREIIQTA